MQILAKTKDGVLITASENEVARILGFSYASENNAPRIEPGLQVEINEVYDAMHTAAFMVGQKHRGGLLGMAGDLKAYSDALNALAAAVQPFETAAMHTPMKQ